jgi:hypothetical protein
MADTRAWEWPQRLCSRQGRVRAWRSPPQEPHAPLKAAPGFKNATLGARARHSAAAPARGRPHVTPAPVGCQLARLTGRGATERRAHGQRRALMQGRGAAVWHLTRPPLLDRTGPAHLQTRTCLFLALRVYMMTGLCGRQGQEHLAEEGLWDTARAREGRGALGRSALFLDARAWQRLPTAPRGLCWGQAPCRCLLVKGSPAAAVRTAWSLPWRLPLSCLIRPCSCRGRPSIRMARSPHEVPSRSPWRRSARRVLTFVMPHTHTASDGWMRPSSSC